VDGPNLYEAFRGNPARFTDPLGTEAGDEPGYLDTILQFLTAVPVRAGPADGRGPPSKGTAACRRRHGAEPRQAGVSGRMSIVPRPACLWPSRSEPVVARVAGGAQVVGGAAEAATGVVIVIVSEGFGAAPGVVFTGARRRCRPPPACVKWSRASSRRR